LNLSIVIPVYAGEHTLPTLVNSISAVFEGITEYEIILVFDQGKDNSWGVIKELKKAYPSRIRGVKLKKNYGQHHALMCGFAKTKGDLVVTLDEDMQYYPEEINKLIAEQVQTCADLVYGIPEKYQQPYARRFLSKILHLTLKYTVKGLNSNFSSLRLVKGQLARRLHDNGYPYPFLDAILAREAQKTKCFMVKHHKRINGTGSWTMVRLWKHISRIIIYYSTLPLLIMIFSFCLFLIAGLFLWFVTPLLVALVWVCLISGLIFIAASLLLMIKCKTITKMEPGKLISEQL